MEASDGMPTTSVPPCQTPVEDAAGRVGNKGLTSISAGDGGKKQLVGTRMRLGSFNFDIATGIGNYRLKRILLRSSRARIRLAGMWRPLRIARRLGCRSMAGTHAGRFRCGFDPG